MTVAMVLNLPEDGLCFADIVYDYHPQLTPEDIAACVAYARAAVEGEEAHYAEEPAA